ncbi:hypothetical protein B9Z55_010770 [Caenorhabditis nigoni]|nr:hypothetical protein B9Z55_010770 [Caenorhabditis nigoni]
MMVTHSHMDSCQGAWNHASMASTGEEDGAQKLQKCLMTSRDSNSAPPHTRALDYRTTPARTQRRSQAVKRRFRRRKLKRKSGNLVDEMDGSKENRFLVARRCKKAFVSLCVSLQAPDCSNPRENKPENTYRLTHSLLPSPCLPKPSDSKRSHHAGTAVKGCDSQADGKKLRRTSLYFPPFLPIASPLKVQLSTSSKQPQDCVKPSIVNEEELL